MVGRPDGVTVALDQGPDCLLSTRAAVMDPDAALRELRDIFTLIKAHRRMTPDQLDHAAELFDGLDNWLTTGGFAPVAWRVSWQGR